MNAIQSEINWFKQVLNLRFLLSYERKLWPEKMTALSDDEKKALLAAENITDIAPPDLSNDSSAYASLVNHYELNAWERIVLTMSLLPSVQPEVLDIFLSAEVYSQYGGIKLPNHKGFIPTVQTALYVLAGTDLDVKGDILGLFSDQHIFRRANLISLGPVVTGEPEFSAALIPSREVLDLVMRGHVRPPDFGNDFPAKRITTEMSWEDLVLSPVTQRQVEEVKIWLRNRSKLRDELGLGKRMKPGYKILFHGSPGTGKTLTACLLGQYTQRHVFRIDLSMIVSKYIGETEKNLAKVFDKAEHADWILFFDEADALFGSRTKVSSSHDRYANQEVSYLLQRIEDYNGIVILASNMKGNIDEAFIRRFSSVVHFPFPKPEERLQLWKKAVPEKISLAADVDMKRLADRYEMSGANITNIVAWCALMALDKGDMMVTEAMMREGVARELAKEGRTL